MRRNLATLVAFCLLAAAEAATVRFDWEVSWVTAAPDGFARPVIGVNGRWPCPAIEASVGDTIIVKLTNSLGNQTTGLHFHGINQVSFF
jgi:iron transport multicopper oxidase